MTTELTKRITRLMEYEGHPVIVELSPAGLAFRKPGARTRSKLDWRDLFKMIPASEHCRDANRTIAIRLGINGG